MNSDAIADAVSGTGAATVQLVGRLFTIETVCDAMRGNRISCKTSANEMFWEFKHPRVALVAGLNLLFSLLPGAAAPAQRPSNLYNEAVAEVRSGNFAGGCAKAQELRLDPRSSAHYDNLLGLCAVGKGDARAAEAFFRKSIALNPKFVDAHNNLATELAERGQYQAAVAEFNQVLRLEAGNVTALYNLGHIELGMGRVNPAVEHLQQAATRAPDDDQIALTLADALSRSNHSDEAGKILASLIEKSTESGRALKVAVVALEAGQPELAIRAIRRAVALDSKVRRKILDLARMASDQKKYSVVASLLDSADAPAEQAAEWNALQGYAHYKLGHPEKALPLLQRALELDPKVEDYYMKMGELMLYYKSQQPAIAYFQTGLKLLPESALLHYGLAVSYVSGRFYGDEARPQLEAALHLQPGLNQALSLYCVILHRMKDPRLKAAAEQQIQCQPNSHEGYYYKSLALVEESRQKQPPPGEAQYLLRRAIQLNPKFAPAHVELGKLLTARGDWQLAIAEFRQAAALNSQDASAVYELARAYQKSGELGKARETFEAFEKLKTKEPDKWLEMFQLSK